MRRWGRSSTRPRRAQYAETASKLARRTVHELSPAERARLEEAHRALRTAVATYERFVVVEPLESGGSAPVVDVDELRAAQTAVDPAEEHLWHLREELLGWVRPSWAPSASLTSDWFSDEDAIYDDLPESTVS